MILETAFLNNSFFRNEAEKEGMECRHGDSVLSAEMDRTRMTHRSYQSHSLSIIYMCTAPKA